MTDAEKTVFISYRRNVSSFIARAIFLDLRTNGYDVFMDVESIDSGTFDTVILNQIEARGWGQNMVQNAVQNVHLWSAACAMLLSSDDTSPAPYKSKMAVGTG